MNQWWEDLQVEYDALLLQPSKSDRDYQRLAEIETALIGKFGPDALFLGESHQSKESDR